MSITTYLQQILAARYGKDVRQSIHDAIEEGYNIAVAAQDVAQTSQESAEAYAAAALASEQAAQEYMELAEQYKDEAFSGTPTGYSDLVAKVNSIYKETASSFGVVDTVEGLALAHTIYGMSEQNGTPTPSVPVDIESAVANFKCVGKNLIKPLTTDSAITYTDSSGITITFNTDGTIYVNGTTTAGVYIAINRKTINNVTYGENIPVYDNTYYCGLFLTGSTIPTTGTQLVIDKHNAQGTYIGRFLAQNVPQSGTLYSFEGEEDYLATLNLYVPSGSTCNFTIRPLLTIVNDNNYLPYQSKTITTDLTLRAIEVTSSDDYNLVKDGKYYVADTLDWDEDNGYSITRRIGEWLLDGSEDENYMIGTINYDCFIALDNLYNLSGANAVTKAKTNRFSTAVSRNDFYNSEKSNYNAFITTFSNTFQAPCFAFRVNGVTSVDLLRTWLSENNVVLVYRLATPTSETVTSAQAQALLGLKTYDEATSIDATGDVAPSIDLEYSKDRNTALALIGHNMAHINALKIADLSA